MRFGRFFYLFYVCIILSEEVEPSTHWIVTEGGLIQPKLHSPFDMAHSHDLIGFLNQEKRWDKIFVVYKNIMEQQAIIDTLWFDVEKYLRIAKQIVLKDECVKAGDVNMLDWYAAILEDGSTKVGKDEYKFHKQFYNTKPDIPDCKRISSLTFSMSAFEHLEGMIQRENLTASPEYLLPEALSPLMTLDKFGNWLTGLLKQNTTSWLHYHLASLYWRIKGIAPKALECSRRAVHYAPRPYKDVALGSLGVVLHRSTKLNDSIIVLNAAVEHDPNNYVNHFSLGNAYTLLGEYNNSLKHYDRTLELNPNMELAVTHRIGVVCHSKLAVKMRVVREMFSKLRNDLKIYKQKEADWPKMQAEFLKTIKNGEEYDYDNVEKNCEKMSDITGLNIKELKANKEKNSLLQYFIDGRLYSDEHLGKQGISVIDKINSLERLIHHVNKNTQNRDGDSDNSDSPLRLKIFRDPEMDEVYTASLNYGDPEPRSSAEKKTSATDGMSEYETGIHMYPPSMHINRNIEDFDKEVDWPSSTFCKEVSPSFPPNVEAIFPVFMPFENRGIRLKSLLTEKIGVPITEECELPWHPPICPQDRETAFLTPKKSKQHMVTDVVKTGYLRQKLLEYVSDGIIEFADHMQDAEIGQRIYAAMKKKNTPKWIVLTLSSLYWRVRGNNMNALHCLLTALKLVQQIYRDIVLVSLASVYLEMGYYDEALNHAEEAFKLSLYEPATNFILAELNMVKKHRNTHMFHLKQAVRVEPDFMDGLARNLLNGWACIMKQVRNLRESDFLDGDICTHVKPFVNMACEKDGDNCQITNIQCYNKHERADTSTLLRILEEKTKKIQEEKKTDDKEEALFNHFIENTPNDDADRLTHHANFKNMVNMVDTVLKGCGPLGCQTLQPSDLDVKEEECAYQHLQLGYWLHIISFRQLLVDSDTELPPEISTIAPSNRKVPECRVPTDSWDDFYLEKLSRLDTDEWEPLITLMHQFAEMFDFYDYVTLGSKIARFIETHPLSWTGALSAGWWCGAGGRGACAVRCVSAAHALAPAEYKHLPLRSLTALLHMQSKHQEAKDISYLGLYMKPKSKVEAFIVAVSHAYLGEYEQAIWMYRYSLNFDEKFLPSKACLHATMCLLFYGEKKTLV